MDAGGRAPTVGALGNSGDKAEMQNREIIASPIPKLATL